MQLRSIMYGMLFGALVGGVLVTSLRQMFLGQPLWLDVASVMRNTAVYVLPLVVVASVSLLRVLVRHRLLHFVGFTGAGVVAGGVVTAFYLLANLTLGWFPAVTTVAMTYVFFSAVVVAWSIWLISMLLDRFGPWRDAKR